MKISCAYCKNEVDDKNIFCSFCGHKLDKQRRFFCLQCGNELKEANKFCTACGAKAPFSIPGKGKSEGTPTGAICSNCRYFRKAVPISSRLFSGISKEVHEILIKIKENETKLRDSEAKQRVELIKISRMEWGFKPVMSDFCAKNANTNVYEICELKNRAGDCKDFESGRSPVVNCSVCQYFNQRPDPYADIAFIMDKDIYSKAASSIDAQWAVEIKAVYDNQGKYHEIPKFHDYCSYHSNAEFVALPYPNIHKDCVFFEPKAGY
jgi:hypothetical protein